MLCYAMECKASFTTLHAMIGDSNLFSVPCYVMRYRALQRHAPGAISDLNASISVYFHLLDRSRPCPPSALCPPSVVIPSFSALLVESSADQQTGESNGQMSRRNEVGSLIDRTRLS